MKRGVWFYGVGTALTGVLTIAWSAFDVSHQPFLFLGKNSQGQHMLSYVVGIWLAAAGIAVLLRGSAKLGALASAFAYSIFVLMWLLKCYAGIHTLGWRFNVLAGSAFGVAQQAMLIAPAAIVYVSPPRHFPRCKGGSQWRRVGCWDCLLSFSAPFILSASKSSRPSSRIGCRSHIFGQQ